MSDEPKGHGDDDADAHAPSSRRLDGSEGDPLDDAALLAELEEGGLDDVDVRELLREALESPGRGSGPSVLDGVQRRLREETGGRYFADGWATSAAPRETYLVTSAIMLAVVVAIWALLGPTNVRWP